MLRQTDKTRCQDGLWLPHSETLTFLEDQRRIRSTPACGYDSEPHQNDNSASLRMSG
jgi:hypothetical protein